MNFFKNSKAIACRCGSTKTLGLHFEKSDTTFFFSLSHFEEVLRSGSQLYNMLL